jgi:soluble lytic murein transglycosylase-like protein
MITSALKESKLSKMKVFAALGFLLLFLLYSSNAEASAVSELKKKYDHLVTTIANNYNIDPQLVHSIILVESNYDKYAVSSKGAMGLMQLMPETAKDYGVKDIFDPYENIKGGVRYLRHLMNYYDQEMDLYLAAYNAGPEAVEKHGRAVPQYPETKRYIKKVKTFYRQNGTAKKLRSRIYKFYDESGKVVLTNSPHLYSIYKNRKTK